MPEETPKVSKSFWQGIAGGFIGIILFFVLLFGFFALMDKISQTNIDCVLEKETQTGNIKCQILEIKDRGDILRISEISSSPKNIEELKRLKNKITTGKFLEVKINIENTGKERQNIGEMILIDGNSRKYSNYGDWEIGYWLPPESQEFWSIGPGLKKEVSQIFEVPQDANNFKLRLKLQRLSRID
jgi:hypothetical protein